MAFYLFLKEFFELYLMPFYLAVLQLIIYFFVRLLLLLRGSFFGKLIIERWLLLL